MPLQGCYSGALPTAAQLKKAVSIKTSLCGNWGTSAEPKEARFKVMGQLLRMRDYTNTIIC